MQEEAARRGLPLPDEGAARERWLRRDIEAPALDSVKDFLRFYITTRQPQLTDKPTVDSINTVAEWFFAVLLELPARRPRRKSEVMCTM